jgi:hypothetical protein
MNLYQLLLLAQVVAAVLWVGALAVSLGLTLLSDGRPRPSRPRAARLRRPPHGTALSAGALAG